MSFQVLSAGHEDLASDYKTQHFLLNWTENIAPIDNSRSYLCTFTTFGNE